MKLDRVLIRKSNFITYVEKIVYSRFETIGGYHFGSLNNLKQVSQTSINGRYVIVFFPPNLRSLVYLQQEQQRAMVNEMVAKITDLCWDKCITGSVGSSMSSGESTCLTNCARRYLDLSMLTMQKFKNMH